MPGNYPLLKRALRFMTSRCDGAATRDDVGFNGMDAAFGRKLANEPELSHRQAKAALKMLTKYRDTQLEPNGHDLEAIRDEVENAPEPEKTPNEVRVIDGNPCVFFDPYQSGSFDEDLVNLVKNHFPWRRFVPADEGGPYWQVGTKTEADIEALNKFYLVAATNGYEFEVEDEVRTIIRRGPSEDPATAYVTPDGSPALKFPYDMELVQEVRDHFSDRHYEEEPEKRWEINSSDQGLLEMESFLEDHPEFDVTDELKDRIRKNKKSREEVAKLSSAKTGELQVPTFNGILKPFQCAGLEYAVAKQRVYGEGHTRVYYGEEMGLGKTVEGLATVEYFDSYPTIVVVPNRVKIQWRSEVERFLPHRSVEIMDGFNGPQPDADIVIINYMCMPKRLDQLVELSPEAVIFDEAHYIKNGAPQDAPKSLKKRASDRAMAASNLVSAANPRVRVLLSGTPTPNSRPIEWIHQLRTMGVLGEFGGFWHFAKRYANAHKAQYGWDFTGKAHLEELNSRLREICFVRRKKADVHKELPPKSYVRHVLDHNEEVYQDAVVEFDQWLHEADEAEKQAQAMVKLTKLRHGAGRAKVDAAVEWIDGFIESDEKLIVFAMHKDVQERLLEEFPHAAHILASDSNEEVEEQKKKFTEEKECTLLIAAMGQSVESSPGGVGHNLQAASNVAFVELGWTPAHHDQCIDRAHRIGQEDRVTAYHLVAEGTIDDHIWNVVDEKRRDGATMIDGVEVAREVMERLQEGGDS